MAPVETKYYDLLGVPVDVNDIGLKKAHHKAAMRVYLAPPEDTSYHRASSSAYTEISEAYRVLSDPNLRAIYDKYGKEMVDKEGDSNVEDPVGFFATVFGGERFVDYIGEISSMKNVTNTANTMLSEEKPEAAEASNSNGGGGTNTAPSTSIELHPTAPPTAVAAVEWRVRMLTGKLVERLRPFVEAKNPGGPVDAETATWEARMRREADDLKLESFGVELLHTIGTVYMTKAITSLKSRRFLGIPGYWQRLKERRAVAKDAQGVIDSALSVQQVMQDIERAQLKGDAGEEELQELEIDVTGKIVLASWRSTRFDVVQVLREVVQNVLWDHSANDRELFHRSRGLLLLGAIFKSTVPDESDEERRELERMAAEASRPKKKQAALKRVH